MAEILNDDAINFADYYRSNEAEVKVRAASVFAYELRDEFKERELGKRRPAMFSTKLQHRLEFRPGEVTVWAGYNGHRKSMFTGQVALDLCVQRERVLVASFEMQPARTLARMSRQAMGVARPSNRQLDEFSRWTDGKLWLFDHIGRISPAQFLAVCRFFAEKRSGSQVFVDSMMMVCASEENLDEQKQFATDLVGLAHETGLHVHLIAHCRKPPTGDERLPTKYDMRGTAALSDQVDNVCMVWANRAKRAALQLDAANPKHIAALTEPDAVVLVDKQRNGTYEGKTSLWFDDASLRFVDDRTSPVEPYVLEVLP